MLHTSFASFAGYDCSCACWRLPSTFSSGWPFVLPRIRFHLTALAITSSSSPCSPPPPSSTFPTTYLPNPACLQA